MIRKKILALLLVLALFIPALPFTEDARKKRKDGPDEPKLITIMTEQVVLMR
jgi:hypothetical protein